MKKPTKRILAVLLAMCIALCALQVSSFASVDIPQKSSGGYGKTAPVNPDYIDYVENGNDSENGLVPDTKDLSYLTKNYAKQSKYLSPRINTPQSYDMRDYGYAPATADQGAYGTCWAFQSAGTLESLLVRQNPLISFSVNHLAWFSYKGGKESEIFDIFGISALGPYDFGGDAAIAEGTLAAWKGPVSTSVMPYKPEEKKNEKLRYRSEYHVQDSICFGGAFHTNGHWVSQANVELVKQIMLEKETAVGIDYCHDEIYYNAQTAAFYCDEATYPNHSVLIIGWDDNYSKDNFREGIRPEHDGAWLIKNSWGHNWGNDGTFWLSYEDKSIEYASEYSIEEADNYENNYQYDVCGWLMSVSADDFAYENQASKQGYMANIFTAKGDEQIEAVSFYTTDVNSSYDISIYTGVDENEPTSGKQALRSQSGTEFYCGYHTVELNEPIALKAGERYSVVVKLKNPDYAFPIPTEASFFEYGKSLKYTAKGGESYFSADGKDWHDIIEVNENIEDSYIQVSNVCLKAFTNPIPQSGAKVGRVRFSVPEGQIAVGDTVELIGSGDIYYTVTDKTGVTGEAIKYTAPITVEDECTVAAWIKDGDKDGDVNKNTYTVAKSQLIELFVQQAGKKKLLNLQNGETELEIDDVEYGKPIKIMPHGSGNITVNGKAIKSDEWSEEIMLNPAIENTITVVSSEDGKIPTAYTIRILARALNFDYTAKTVSFDDTLVSVKDPDGNSIASGDSIENYITNSGEAPKKLTVTYLYSGKETSEPVAQKKVLNNKIEFINTEYEATAEFSSAYMYADNPLMNDAKSFNNSSIPLKPGQILYIQRMQDSNYLESNVYKLIVPERPETPTAQIEKVSANEIKLKYVKGAEYRIKGDWWQDSCVFSNVDLSQDYTFEVRIKATDRVFASEIATVDYSGENAQYVTVVYRNSADNTPYMRESVPIFEGKNTIRPNKELASDGYFTLDDSKQTATVNLTNQNGELVADTDCVYFDVTPSVNPTDYSYEVLYFDRSGEQIDRKTLPYSYAGVTLQSEMPVPEGYKIYNADNDNYTALRPISGEWRCIYNKQIVIVEKDTVIYGDADGDGEITMLDVLIIRKFIAKQPVTPNTTAADVTHDGTIDMLDALKIRKFIAKQPVDLANAG